MTIKLKRKDIGNKGLDKINWYLTPPSAWLEQALIRPIHPHKLVKNMSCYMMASDSMVPSDPFTSHLATQLGYSVGEFQVLQLIVLAAFGVVD